MVTVHAIRTPADDCRASPIAIRAFVVCGAEYTACRTRRMETTPFEQVDRRYYGFRVSGRARRTVAMLAIDIRIPRYKFM